MSCKKILAKKSFDTAKGSIEGAVLFFGVILIFIVFLPRLLFPTRPASSSAPSPSPSFPPSNSPGVSLGPSVSASPLPSSSPVGAVIPPSCVSIEVLPSLTGRAPFSAVLVAHAQKATFEIAGFRWDFNNDGIWDTQTSMAPRGYTFQAAGDYTIRLQVLDVKGNSGLCTAIVKVTP